MGYGDIGPFGSTVNKTPHLDRMAREGRVLMDFYVSSTACTPSRSALMTGCYADRVGMDGGVVFPGDKRGLNPDEVTIAEMLKARGYATGCFGKWHLGDQPGFMPDRQGFDTYTGIPYSNDMWPGKKDRVPLPFVKNHKVVAHISEGRSQAVLGDAVSDAAAAFIRQNSNKPFFCYFPHSMIHVPRYVLKERAEKADGSETRAQIEEIDASVGRIMATLEELGISKNTLVFFTSDNGGSGGTSMGPLRGGKGGAKYEGHMRVPTVAWWPGTIPAGTVSSEIGATIDLLPTIAKLAGAQVPKDRVIDGKDYSNVLLGKPGAKSPHDILFYEYEGARVGKWKLVIAKTGKSELYDLEADIGETTNLAEKHPQIMKELEEKVAAHRKSVEANKRPAAFVEAPKPIPTAGLPSLVEYLGLGDIEVVPDPAIKKGGTPAKKKKAKVKKDRPVAVAQQVAAIFGDLLFENSDFEKGTLENWKAEGDAFTVQPTKGDNPIARRRKEPAMQQGDYWIGTYEKYDGKTGKPGARRGDKPTGTLTSIPFTVEKKFIVFRVGGGSRVAEVGVKLVCDGKEKTLPAGSNSETMRPVSVDVSEFLGKEVQLVIYDHATKGFGHVNADDFRAADKLAGNAVKAAPLAAAEEPVNYDNFDTYLDIGYDQTLRPQFHFSSRKNWLNDPNGMVYYDGEWHMYFQHVAIANNTGPKSWGSAVSTDLIHWEQLPHAIVPYPSTKPDESDRDHTIWSGSAVVDVHNALGKQKGNVKTLYAIYTATHRSTDHKSGFFQAAAYSTDKGRTWTKINDGGPMIDYQQGYTLGQRDPRIFYYAPGKYHVVIMMVGGKERAVRLWKSTDLMNWEIMGDIPNKAAECIDMYTVAVDGDKNNMKWVIADAGTHYEVGDFDGRNWKGDNPLDEKGRSIKEKFDFGDSYYAAQVFNQAPDGRVVHIGWLRSKQQGFRPFLEAGMPFTQQMSVPAEITLRTTPDGIRMFRNPVKEIEKLHVKTDRFKNLSAKEANAKLTQLSPELIDMTIEFAPQGNLALNVRGLEISYDAANEEFSFTNTARVEGERAVAKTRPAKKQKPYKDDGFRAIPAPAVNGTVKLRVLVDRVSLELFANDGQAAASFVVVPKADNRSISIKSPDKLKIKSLVVNELKSAWGK